MKRKKPNQKEINMPRHIAVIMDGNGRWAKKRGLPRSAGHRAGCKAIQNLVEACENTNLAYLTAFAFSTENWKRPKAEVENLMKLLQEFLNDTEKKLDKSNVKIKVIGSMSGLNEDIIHQIKRIEEKSKNKMGLTFVIALNYGSKEEITHAFKEMAHKIKEGDISINDISQDLLNDHLYTKEIPEPDLIIRPSGEMRLSNFLLWQASYSELWFSDILWPDFRMKHLQQAVKEYQKRERRYGGL